MLGVWINLAAAVLIFPRLRERDCFGLLCEVDLAEKKTFSRSFLVHHVFNSYFSSNGRQESVVIYIDSRFDIGC
jgi:hypothetical protein